MQLIESHPISANMLNLGSRLVSANRIAQLTDPSDQTSNKRPSTLFSLLGCNTCSITFYY